MVAGQPKSTRELGAIWRSAFDLKSLGIGPVLRLARRSFSKGGSLGKGGCAIVECWAFDVGCWTFRTALLRSSSYEGHASHCDTWWTPRDSNPRPPRCKRDALTN